jgi:hypothetical protein
MTSSPRLETQFDSRGDQQVIVREWRAEQLRRLGVPPARATSFADRVDRHAVAGLVDRGYPPRRRSRSSTEDLVMERRHMAHRSALDPAGRGSLRPGHPVPVPGP